MKSWHRRTHERGERINALERGHIALQTTRARHRGDIQQLAARQNLAIDPAKVKNPQRVLASLQDADKWEEECRRIEAAQNSGMDQ